MTSTEWTIVCNHCGQFYYIGPEPVLCPKCYDTEIDVYPQYELEVSDHEDDLSGEDNMTNLDGIVIRNLLSDIEEQADYGDGYVTFPAVLLEQLQKAAGMKVESHYTEPDLSEGHMNDVRFGGSLDETGE